MVSRRTMLTVTAGAVLGAVTPVAAAAPAAAAIAKPRTIPRTLSVRRTVRHGRLRVPNAGIKLSHLGVTWRGPVAQIRLRTATGWTAWRTIDGCTGGRDGRGHEGGGTVLAAPGALGYEVWVAGTGTAQVTEINTVNGPASTMAEAAQASTMPLPRGMTCNVPYLSRAAWGADESLRFTGGVEDFPPEYHPVQTVTVHHSATVNGDSNPAATVRAIYYDQAVTKGWGDVGYQLFIDEAGRVYEGRWSGSDSVPIFAAPSATDPRPWMSTGAHVGGFNSGNLGICLLGDFTSRLPAAAARESLTRLLTSLTVACRLDPTGITDYFNPSNGATKTLNTIPGHREWAATQCPGNLFYPELATLRAETARRNFTYLRRTSVPDPDPGDRGSQPRPTGSRPRPA